MALERIPDHQARAVARLAEQYKGSESFTKLVSLATAEAQVIEDVLWATSQETIDSAEGAGLDVIGKIVGQPREGRDDPTYRIWIRARVRINRSGGTPEDIIAVFAAITQGSTPIVIEEQFPAAIVVKIGSASIVDPVALAAILQQAKAAGVNAILESATSDDATSFACAPNGAGCGTTTNPDVGGTLAGAL